MKEGNADFWYAYHIYHSNGLLPSQFAVLPKEEKAILMAFIDIKADAEEKANKKMR